MKKTIACMAMIASATAFAADKKPTAPNAAEKRDPSSNYEGYTFAGCRPAYPMYKDNEAYKNDCTIPLQTVSVPVGGFTPPGTTMKVLGCDADHQLVVTSTPMRFRCLPPGVAEL